jgi:hypothetical protein
MKRTTLVGLLLALAVAAPAFTSFSDPSFGMKIAQIVKLFSSSWVTLGHECFFQERAEPAR